MEKFGEDITVVARLVQWNFARKGVEEELKDESNGFYVYSRRIATLSSTLVGVQEDLMCCQLKNNLPLPYTF